MDRRGRRSKDVKYNQTYHKWTAEDVGPYSTFSVYVNFAAVRYRQTVLHGRSKPLPYRAKIKLAVSAYLKPPS